VRSARTTRISLAATAAGAGLALGVTLAAPAFAASAPVARDDSYTTAVNTNLVIGAPGVLSNDTDADGNAIGSTLLAGAQHGNVGLSANGAFTYVPTTNYIGPDQFTYRACDTTRLCDTATVFITVKGSVPTLTTEPVPPPVGGGAVVYPTCAAAFRAGVHDIPRGDPRYRSFLDRDGDGWACGISGDDTRPPVTVVPGPTTVGPSTVVPGPTISGPATQVPGPVIQGGPTYVPGPVVSVPNTSSGIATGDGSTPIG